MTREEIEVVYRLRVPAAELAARTEALLLEQTVELPRQAVRLAYSRDNLVGRVVSTREAGPDGFTVTLAQPAANVGTNPAQLLNVLFGNCSLQPDVQLEDVRLPASVAGFLGGPRFGVAGIRRIVGVSGRALTASVLKPVGLSVSEAASLCRSLALAGIDIIKDDHGLADQAFCPFPERVRACLAATEDAAQKTGRRSLYVPSLVGTPTKVLHQAWKARELGAGAAMVSPMLVGLPFLNELAADIGMPILAHPAFAGAPRISPAALLGRLFRAFGADAVIFPNAGGRFSFDREACSEIAAALRVPDPCAAPAFPVPAGGIRRENVQDVLATFGADTILLLGGSLLEAGSERDLIARCGTFVSAVREHAA
ncbi:MAG TPA: RuBisCO large subunit C-terminal-like domain-containing protein [Opitutaceae bacterium]|jgi:ribulose-bisphosphate carboxylase large chain